ncbi:hypothetical protein C7H52_10935 [Aurantibacter aestuarii]|uniref:Uncharacterized protein n=1 Tax=Aurantibacter aestuarii TaxID=1266046 RepID=A0A2T1N713_9FLAO|nr:hypothetical protein C7H52_10935 [Aurantibacter aestuarii]
MPKSEYKTQADGKFKRNFKKALIGILSTIIPKANPDFEEKIDFVETWIVELDNETGIPKREIGMDKDGRIILKMPYKKNYGFWTDSNLVFTDFKNEFDTSEITKDTFENYWNLFEKTEDFEIELTDYKIQSTGADGGHKYLKSKVDFKEQKREIIILFTNKKDEQRILDLNKIRVRGKIVDDGIEQPLTLYETKLITE